MMRLVAVSGSLRRDSANTTLLRAAVSLAPPGTHITLFDQLGSLPHFNPDIEHDDIAAVTAWRTILSACDGIVIACPEYAHGVPGAFKNALDWAVGSTGAVSKPVALINSSARAVHAHAALLDIVTTMGWRVVQAASPVIPVAGKNYSVVQIVNNEAFARPLLAAIEALTREASKPGSQGN